MGFFDFDVIVEQDRTTARREAQAQNAARLALFRYTHATAGVGPVRVDTPIQFDVVFLEQPHFTSGFRVQTPGDPTVWHLPTGGASVWRWVRTTKGQYTGAFVALDVRMETISGAVEDYPAVRGLHDLLFSGVAMKKFGDAVSTQAQLLQPRTVALWRS